VYKQLVIFVWERKEMEDTREQKGSCKDFFGDDENGSQEK
jgi:hypothetical protein